MIPAEQPSSSHEAQFRHRCASARVAPDQSSPRCAASPCRLIVFSGIAVERLKFIDFVAG